jgi:ABC-type oligopeptide transport system ATPase subunit
MTMLLSRVACAVSSFKSYFCRFINEVARIDNSRKRKYFMSLIKEVKDWKLEAKSENTERYFYHVDEVDNIARGTAAYVIGRKGTGKTAIAEYLLRLNRFDTFSEKVTFKNFPFNELYGLNNSAYTNPNQYITFWKYLIYSLVCKMMVRNEGVDPSVREILEKVYSPAPLKALSKWISRWTANDFSISVLGTGGKIGLKETSGAGQPWPERLDVLEEIIALHATNTKYYVVFDELDEDYKNMTDPEHYQQYTDLLTSLFKAVQDVKAVFKDQTVQILPVVFLRDDIYGVLMDSDKTKWDDFKIDLEWNHDRIKKLLAFRLTRAKSEGAKSIKSFNHAWLDLFSPAEMDLGHAHHRKTSIFEYISRHTQQRPRDYIKYIQACASEAPANARTVSTDVVKRVSKTFSNHLRKELIDEIHAIVPDIIAVFNIISQIRKQTFSIDEFTREFERQVKNEQIKDKDVTFVLNVLFNFSVIGNQPSQKNVTVFRYENKDAQLNFREKLVVHRGLYNALQIL